jgi:OmpA-OmpF porin, OOP family
MERMMKRLIATAALATLVATPALAQSYPGVPDEGFYLGTAIGQAKLKNALDDYDRAGWNTDDKDTAFKLFAGYQFNPNFAVEASYVDFGKFSANAVTDYEEAYIPEIDDVASRTVRENDEVSIDGFGFALVGRLPIDAGFSVFGKLGLFAWDGSASFSESTTYRVGNDSLTTSERDSASFDDIDPFYGIGVEYVVNQVMVRAEFERYDLSDSDAELKTDLISASIGYRF